MAHGPAIERIDVPKSCDLLADQLRRQIFSGTYAPGAALPAERELVVQSGLSRGSVREALRIVEAEGLIRTKAGRYGGSVVCLPTDELLARHVAMFAKGRGVTLPALIDAREALEPMVAQLAALHRTADDLRELEAISARLEVAMKTDAAGFLEHNVHWHYAVAVASHNDILRGFMASLTGLIHETSHTENLVDDDVRALVARTHRRILDAIVAGDPDAARRRMERHVKAYSRQADHVLAIHKASLRPSG